MKKSERVQVIEFANEVFNVRSVLREWVEGKSEVDLKTMDFMATMLYDAARKLDDVLYPEKPMKTYKPDPIPPSDVELEVLKDEARMGMIHATVAEDWDAVIAHRNEFERISKEQVERSFYAGMGATR